LTASF